MRPRVNQPSGYRPFGGMAPRYVYGRRHDYIYYPVAWVDNDTGRSYEKGYYDENGQHYDDVAFNKDGQYKNVVCHCPYCDKDTVVDMSSEDAAGKTLQCPSCGAPMQVNSFLDDYASGSQERSPDSDDRAATRSDRRRMGCLISMAILLSIVIITRISARIQRPDPMPILGGTQQITTVDSTSSNVDLFGETVYLAAGENGGFTITDSADASDRNMVWDYGEECYYDEASDCWLWFNTDVTPPVWQYWYEGISSDFGDYGWMEYEDGIWYIEADEGNWIELPAGYDAGQLWHIDA